MPALIVTNVLQTDFYKTLLSSGELYKAPLTNILGRQWFLNNQYRLTNFMILNQLNNIITSLISVILAIIGLVL